MNRAKIADMSPRHARLVLSIFLAASCLFWQADSSPAQGQQPDHETGGESAGDRRPVVVELFTSEGCSSCPPADVFLKKLDTDQPIQGAQIIVLSEHVTYWDQEGWKDPNGSAALTERQSSYETALGEKDPFTPQIVVDGDHEVTVQSFSHFGEVLRQARDEAKIPVHITELRIDGAPVLHAHIDTGENVTGHNAEVFLAVALGHVESQVLRGENGGRHLVHVAVVQKLTRIGKLSKGKTFTDDVQLKLAPSDDPTNLRVVAFVQEPGPGKILGAALRKPGS